eukprot:s1282_g12.t1
MESARVLAGKKYGPLAKLQGCGSGACLQICGWVEATPVTVAQLRHLALEGIAFGFLLGEAERSDGPRMAKPGPAHSELFGSFDWSFLGARGGRP